MFKLLKNGGYLILTFPFNEKIYIDKRLEIDDINWNTYGIIERLAPFGLGNPKPLFLFEN